MNVLLKVMLNAVGENSMIIGRGCPIDASVVLEVTARSLNIELKLKRKCSILLVYQRKQSSSILHCNLCLSSGKTLHHMKLAQILYDMKYRFSISKLLSMGF